MTAQDRTEVRAMLNDVLLPYLGEDGTIRTSLTRIDKYLEKLNGTVASHEKTINQNIPHTIAHCSQAETIKSLEANMITSAAVKKFFGWSVGIIVSIITILWGINEIFLK